MLRQDRNAPTPNERSAVLPRGHMVPHLGLWVAAFKGVCGDVFPYCGLLGSPPSDGCGLVAATSGGIRVNQAEQITQADEYEPAGQVSDMAPPRLAPASCTDGRSSR